MPIGPLSQQQIDALLNGGFIKGDTASMLARQAPPPSGGLETLDREGSAPSDPNAIRGNANQLGEPGMLEKVTGLPIDKVNKVLQDPSGVGLLSAVAKPPAPAPPSSETSDIDIGKGVKPNSTPLLKGISLPSNLQSQGAAFGAPPKLSDVEPQKAPSDLSVDLRGKGKETQAQAESIGDDQKEAGLQEHQDRFGKMADNPSLRPNAGEGPAVPISPDGQDNLSMHILGQAASNNNKAVDAWKKGVTDLYDGYVAAPINKQIDIAHEQGLLNQSLANELYKGSSMAQAIADQAKQRDANDRMAELKANQDKLDELEKYSKSLRGTDVSTGHFWSNKTQNEKAFTIIGSLVSGLAGHPGQLNRLIEQDVNLQIANLDNKRKGVDQERGVLSDQLKTIGDKSAVREAARIALIEGVQGQVSLIAKKYGSDQAAINSEALTADLEKQKADSYAKLWNYLNPDPRRAAAGGAGIPKGLEYQGSKTVRLGDGTTFIASDEKAATEIRDGVEAADGASAAVARMKDLLSNPRTYIPGTAENNEYDSQVQRMRLATDSKFLGIAKSEEGRKILNEATAIPSQYSPETAKKLDKLNERVNQTLHQKVRADNGTVVQEQFIRDPVTGLPKRIAVPTGETTFNYKRLSSGAGAARPPGIRAGAAK